MKIELNAEELQAAVVAHLTNVGMDMKKKDIDFEFEGVCTIYIESQVSEPIVKAPVKRAAKKVVEKQEEPVATPEPVEEKSKPKAKAKKEEPVEPDEVMTDTPESVEDLFGTAKATTPTETVTEDEDDEGSLFG